MTKSRDDMVITPSLADGQGAASRGVAARRGRRVIGQDPRKRSLARRAAGGAARSAALRLGLGAVGGAAAGAAVLALMAAIAVRLGTGRTFENLTQLMSDKAFGKLPVALKAKMVASERILSNERRLRIADRENSVGGLTRLLPFETEDARRKFEGQAMLLRENEFTSNSDLEAAILAGSSLFKEAFWNDLAAKAAQSINTARGGW